jgi:hypothetical protein
LWGLNHQRQPLAVAAGLDVSAASVEELRGLCLDLVDEVNGLRDHVKEDANGVMRLAAGPADALRRARLGYEGIETEYALLDGGLAGRPKGLMLSAVMSWIGPSGVYSPFTAEPNVNMELPHTEIPTTVCHEMAHRLGFAREDEANFIGYLAARRHPDVDFRYGGALEALSYALRALASADSESVSEILDSCSEGVRRDWDAERAFYQRHRSPVSKVTHRINDAYLKSQGQAAGACSYGRMVDLLIADRRRRASNRD